MKPQVRKVQKLGLSSLGVSLPKAWIKDLGVEAGSTVVIQQEEDGTLRVGTDLTTTKSRTPECLLDADNCKQEGFLERLILASYNVGCDTIKIKARGELDAGQIKEIQTALSRLTGVTPVDQGMKYLTLENFAEPSRFPVEGLLRRLHFLVSRIQNLIFQMAVQGGDFREQIRVAGGEVDRLYNFATRQLLLAAREPAVAKQIGLDDPRHIVGGRAFALLMQNVADSYVEMADSWLVLGIDPRPRVGLLVDVLNSLWRDFNSLSEITMGAFFGKDIERANDALDRVEKLREAIQEAALKVSLPREEEGPLYCNNCLLLQSLLRPLRFVARLYGDVALVAMNRGVEVALRRNDARAVTNGGTLVPVPVH